VDECKPLIEGIARQLNLYFKTYGKGTNTVLVAGAYTRSLLSST